MEERSQQEQLKRFAPGTPFDPMSQTVKCPYEGCAWNLWSPNYQPFISRHSVRDSIAFHFNRRHRVPTTEGKEWALMMIPRNCSVFLVPNSLVPEEGPLEGLDC